MTEIYVDADACPVKDEIYRVAGRHKLKVFIVSNSFMRLPQSPLIERVLVDEGPDVADDWIADNATANDIAVTADIPLAARCVRSNVTTIGPTGKLFTDDNIGMTLATRNLMTDLRETSNTQTFNAEFSKRDRSNFLQALENAVQAIKRREMT
ncbi:MAG: YaiI/YqxD family protein [Methyloligellaceae bacterium]